MLGYNEPDETAKANLTVRRRPGLLAYMMQSGLRVGAPAVSEPASPGAKADTLALQLHEPGNESRLPRGFRAGAFLQMNDSASQLSNYVAGIYQTVGKPIWPTEFNFGADWCSPDNDTSQTVEAAYIASYISMLESCHFIERYAIYRWLKPTTKWSSTASSRLPAPITSSSNPRWLTSRNFPPGQPQHRGI